MIALLDEDGAALERYRYTPYGERIVLDWDFSEDADNTSDYDQDRGFQGLLHDAESGLIENRARMLDPLTGRFMQRDPLGYPEGMNSYAAYHVMHGGLDPFGKATSVHKAFIAALARGAWAKAHEIMMAAPKGSAWGGKFAVAIAGRMSISLRPALNSADKAFKIVRPNHNWCKVQRLPAKNVPSNASKNFQAIQNHINNAWKRGKIIDKNKIKDQGDFQYWKVSKEYTIKNEKVVVNGRVMVSDRPKVIIDNAYVR